MNETINSQPSIVAEAVSPYGMTPVAYEKSTIGKPRMIAGVEAPDAAWKFANKNELVSHIEMVIQWVREIFPTACNFALEYVIDPEIEDYSWIEVRFYVSGTVEEVFQQYQRLNQKRTQHIPFDKSDMIGVIFGWME